MALYTVTLSWVTISMHHYGKLPWAVSYLLMTLLAAYLSLYVGLFALGFRWASDRFGVRAAMLAPFFWVALEMLRAHLLTGFPWALLGYSQYRFIHIIQVADLTGVYGISFLLVLSNVALWALFTRQERRVHVAIIAMVCTVGALVYGTRRLSEELIDPNRGMVVGVVQGNIEQDKKWDKQFQEETLHIYERLSRQILNVSENSPQLLVWPESAAPFLFEQDKGLSDKIVQFVQKEAVDLLFGSPSVTFPKQGGPLLYNSAFLLSPQGITVGRYNKIHLVPFGEYVPLSGILFFVSKMAEGIGEFQPGSDYTLMSVGGVPFGTVICFEVIFPELVRKFVNLGAGFMATLTNDAWFGNSAAPYQHFSMVTFRSVENRVPFVRSANTGISGFIDPYGRIVERSPLFKETALSQKIYPGKSKTFYTKHGDIFGWGCVIIVLSLGATTLLHRTGNKNKRGGKHDRELSGTN